MTIHMRHADPTPLIQVILQERCSLLDWSAYARTIMLYVVHWIQRSCHQVHLNGQKVRYEVQCPKAIARQRLRERNGRGSVDDGTMAGRARGKQEVHIGTHANLHLHDNTYTRFFMLKNTPKKLEKQSRSKLTWEANEPERKDRPFAAMLFWLTLTTGGGSSPVRLQHTEIGK